MAITRLGNCGGCCVQSHDCETCFPDGCVPRYLKVEAEVSFGPYVDMDQVCCGLVYGIGHLAWRLPFDCAAWSASGRCTGLATPIDLTVTVERIDATTCRTKVDSLLLDAPLYFAGALPAGMAGTITTPDGDVVYFEISTADMIVLPLASARCSPCGCGRCFDRRICATVTLFGTQYEAAVLEAGTLEWDCLSKWTGSVAGHAISLTSKPVDEQVCGVDVTVTGDRATLDSELVFEGPWNPRRFHGAPCRDSDGIVHNVGVPELRPCDPPTPCATPPDESHLTTFDHTFDLFDGEDVIGSLSLKSQIGDVCEACVTEPPVPVNCCEFTPIPRTIHGTWNYGIGTPCSPPCPTVVTAFRYNPALGNSVEGCSALAVWESSVRICGMSFNATLFCCTSFGNSTWSLTVHKPNAELICGEPNPVGGSGATLFSSSCDPLLLDFGFSWSGSCCPGGSDGVGMSCVITL